MNKMTFNNYIQNPMGINNSVFSGREMYKNLYTEKLDKILVRESGKVKYTLYKDNKKDEFYIHMKIPSEAIDKFYYDTLIKFNSDKPELKLSRTLSEYNVQFYSNDPSFVFTFAHAMIKNGLFIEELISKMSKEAVKKVAKEKNPNNQIGYVKSLYFTYLLMNSYGLFNKIQYESYGQKYDKKMILDSIENADIKIEKRTKIQEEKSKKNKKDKSNKINNRESDSFTQKSNIGITSKISSKINNIKTTKKINTIKKK